MSELEHYYKNGTDLELKAWAVAFFLYKQGCRVNELLFDLAKLDFPCETLMNVYKQLMEWKDTVDDMGDPRLYDTIPCLSSALQAGIHMQKMSLVEIYIAAFKQGVIDIDLEVNYLIRNALTEGDTDISFRVAVMKRMQESLPIKFDICPTKKNGYLPIEAMRSFDIEAWTKHQEEFTIKVLPDNKFV